VSAVAAPATTRLFVALEIPAAVRDALAAARDTLDPAVWRPLDDAALHVTLVFLGRRPVEEIEPVAAVVEAVAARAARPVALRLAEPLRLPPRRTRVMAVGLADAGGHAAALQADLVDTLAAAGLHEPEARPFRPHVTVGRVRPRARPGRERWPGPPPLAFEVERIALFASRLHPGGARYEALAGASLR